MQPEIKDRAVCHGCCSYTNRRYHVVTIFGVKIVCQSCRQSSYRHRPTVKIARSNKREG